MLSDLNIVSVIILISGMLPLTFHLYQYYLHNFENTRKWRKCKKLGFVAIISALLNTSMQIVALFIYFYKQAYLDLSDAFYTGFFFSNLIMNLQDLFFGIFTISLILLTKERYIVFAFNLKAKNRKYKFITITVICITVIEYLTDTFNRFLFQTKNEAVQTLSSILFTTVVLSGITFDLYGIFRMIKVSLAYEFIRSKTVRDRMRRYKRLLFLLYFGLVMLDLLAIIVYIFPILIPLQDAFAIQSIPTVMISLHGFGALSIFRLLKKGGKYFKADSDASNFAQSAEVTDNSQCRSSITPEKN